MHNRAARPSLPALFSFALLGLLNPRPAAAQAPTDDALIARIDELAAEALKQPGAAGLSIAVARGDTIILSKGYGKADLENGTPATDASVFRIASVTKQFTAAAIMRFVEQGKLALDDDFTKYVDYPTQGRAVTIRHLLTHTSGIKSYTDVPGFFETGTALDLSPEKVLDPVRNLPFDFEPGSKWAYNNTGYHLLGMIIEKISGVPYAKHMQDEFFTPLSLTHTRYDVGWDVIPGRARGYGVIDGAPTNAPYLSMTIPYSAGGLLSTAGELVQWQLDLVGGKVISPGSYQQMTTPATLSDGSATRYGFGLFMSDVDGHANLMHEGGIPGFNSILVYFPNEKLSIAVISNSAGASAGLVAAGIAREALGIAPKFKDLSLPAAELEPLTGKYRVAAIELDFEVTTANGNLFVQGTGEPPIPVMAQGGGEFRASWDASVRIAFDPPAAPGGKSPSFTFQQGGETFKALRVP